MFFKAIQVYAQATVPTPENYRGAVEIVVDLLNMLIYLGVIVAVVVFIYGIAKFILNAGNEQTVTEGKKFIFWGLITLAILGTFWSILLIFFQDAGFGLDFGIPFLPQ